MKLPNKDFYFIEAIYNSPYYEEMEHVNCYQNVAVYKEDDGIHLNVCRRYVEDEYDSGWQDGEELIVDDAFWDLCYEDIEHCYMAFHNWAVAYDGSHLSYMDVKMTKHIGSNK